MFLFPLLNRLFFAIAENTHFILLLLFEDHHHHCSSQPTHFLISERTEQSVDTTEIAGSIKVGDFRKQWNKIFFAFQLKSSHTLFTFQSNRGDEKHWRRPTSVRHQVLCSFMSESF